MNASGKVLKRELRLRYADRRIRAAGTAGPGACRVTHRTTGHQVDRVESTEKEGCHARHRLHR